MHTEMETDNKIKTTNTTVVSNFILVELEVEWSWKWSSPGSDKPDPRTSAINHLCTICVSGTQCPTFCWSPQPPQPLLRVPGRLQLQPPAFLLFSPSSWPAVISVEVHLQKNLSPASSPYSSKDFFFLSWLTWRELEAHWCVFHWAKQSEKKCGSNPTKHV